MRRRTNPRGPKGQTDDRGVSEVLGFILVFAIILGSVTLLSMTGFQAMQDYQEGEQLRNAERAMEAFAENANDVMRYDGIDTRRGELSLQEGTVRTSDGGTKLNITIQKTGGSTVDIPEDEFSSYGTGGAVNIGEFTYIVDDDRIAYEGGGVVRGDDSGSVFLKQPQLRCNTDDEMAVISLVTISADNQSIQSSGQVGFTISEVDNPGRTSNVYTDVDDVSIDVQDSPNEHAWNRTLGHGDWERKDGTKGKCNLDDGKVVVTLVEVNIEY
ncbi:MAG: type IV pilus modification PilV family protein [Natrinema limicola]